MNFLKKIKENFIWIFFKIRNINLFSYKKIYILDVPMYANLGDQAIIEAEKKILKDNFKNIKIIEVSSYILDKIELYKKFKKMVTLNDVLLLQGGGSLDDRAWRVVERFINIFDSFPKHHIIVFPQTISFSDSLDSKKLLKKLQVSCNKHKFLTLFAREEVSYNKMLKLFPNNNIKLVPDIVLYYNCKNRGTKKTNSIMCLLRNDSEKTLSNDDYINIKNGLKKYKDYKVIFSDTVLKKKNGEYKKLYHSNRVFYLKKCWKNISNSKLVITDRLHGMIFAFINQVPVILLPSLSPKIKGVYNWISKNKMIRYIDDVSKLEQTINEILNNKFIDFKNINFSREWAFLLKELNGVISYE